MCFNKFSKSMQYGYETLLSGRTFSLIPLVLCTGMETDRTRKNSFEMSMAKSLFGQCRKWFRYIFWPSTELKISNTFSMAAFTNHFSITEERMNIMS